LYPTGRLTGVPCAIESARKREIRPGQHALVAHTGARMQRRNRVRLPLMQEPDDGLAR
jgi:hypothetical protein